jgi:hypothetical protein
LFGIFASVKGVWIDSLKMQQKQMGLAMNTGTASFAIKAGYYLLAGGVVVFIAMLAITMLHP